MALGLIFSQGDINIVDEADWSFRWAARSLYIGLPTISKLSGNIASLIVFRFGCYLCLIFSDNENLALSNGVVSGQVSSRSGSLSSTHDAGQAAYIAAVTAIAMTNWRKRCTGRGRSDSWKCANK